LNFAHGGFERAPHRHFGAQRGELRGIGARHRAPADRARLKDCVAPMRDRGQMEQRIRLHAAVIAEEFAVRAFGLGVAALVEIAFQDELGVGGHEQVVRHALDHAHRRAAQRGDEFELVGGNAHGRADMIDRMRPDGECDRGTLAALRVADGDGPQIRRRDEIDARRAAPAQHQAANADVGPARVRIDGEVDRRRNVRRAVEIVLEMHGQGGEVARVAGEHDLLHGCFLTAHFDELAFHAQAFAHGVEQSLRRRIERLGETRSARGDAARERHGAAGRPAEPHGARVAFHDAGDVGEIDGRVMAFEFALVERFEEAAQAEAFEVGRGRAIDGRRNGGVGSQSGFLDAWG
jgi:hypothetical protein